MKRILRFYGPYLRMSALAVVSILGVLVTTAGSSGDAGGPLDRVEERPAEPAAASPSKLVMNTESRISLTRADAEQIVLDFDRQTGNYFAAVRWGDGVRSLHLSTNLGLTWQETASASAVSGYGDIDISVVGGWAYMGYLIGETSQWVILTRHDASTGAIDWEFGTGGSLIVADAGSSMVTDLALDSNQDTDDSEIYLALTQGDGTLRFFFDSAADGTTFAELSPIPAVTNADGGLDMHYNAYENIFVSYFGTDQRAHLLRAYPWSEVLSLLDCGGVEPTTAISAYRNNVMLLCQKPRTYGYEVYASRSYDAGATWSFGSLETVDSPDDPDYWSLDVTARGGQGFAVVYASDDGSLVNPVYLKHKPGYEMGFWEPREVINSHDADLLRPTNITWMPPDYYGIAYIDGSSRTAYFLLYDYSLFSDGFESGNTSAWSASVP